MGKPATLSLKAADDVEGGLFDDFDGTVISARYAMYDYPNKEGKPSTQDGQPVLVVKVDINNPDAEKPITQYYSVGAKGFKPNPADGGKTAIIEGEARGIGKQSNFAVLRNELVNIGFPEESISDDVSFLDGLVAHWNQKEQPKRRDAKEGDKAKKLLVPTKILSLPGEKKAGAVVKGGKGSKAAVAPPAAAAAASGGGDDALKAATVATIVDILSKKKSLTVEQLKMDVFKAEMKNPKRNDMVSLSQTEDFLLEAAMAEAFDFDGTNVSEKAA